MESAPAIAAARAALPAPPGTTGQLHAVQILHPARAHGLQERAMLAHEAWLAKCMRS